MNKSIMGYLIDECQRHYDYFPRIMTLWKGYSDFNHGLVDALTKKHDKLQIDIDNGVLKKFTYI